MIADQRTAQDGSDIEEFKDYRNEINHNINLLEDLIDKYYTAITCEFQKSISKIDISNADEDE